MVGSVELSKLYWFLPSWACRSTKHTLFEKLTIHGVKVCPWIMILPSHLLELMFSAPVMSELSWMLWR